MYTCMFNNNIYIYIYIYIYINKIIKYLPFPSCNAPIMILKRISTSSWNNFSSPGLSWNNEITWSCLPFLHIYMLHSHSVSINLHKTFVLLSCLSLLITASATCKPWAVINHFLAFPIAKRKLWKTLILENLRKERKFQFHLKFPKSWQWTPAYFFIRIRVINSRNDPREKKNKFSVSHSQDVAHLT